MKIAIFGIAITCILALVALSPVLTQEALGASDPGPALAPISLPNVPVPVVVLPDVTVSPVVVPDIAFTLEIPHTHTPSEENPESQ